MNAQSNMPRLSQLLGQVATVVKVSKTSLGLNRLDREASKMSDQQHHAKSGTGKTYASRLSGAEHMVKAIDAKGQEAVDALAGITTAYQGQRILPNVAMQTWLGIWGRIKGEYDVMVDAFKAQAPQMIAQCELNKGDYKVDVPSLQEIDKAFSLTFDMSQIPDSATYVGQGLDAQMNQEMQRQFEAGIEAAWHQSQMDALKRVAEPMGRLIDRLGVYSKTEDEKSRGVVTSSARLYETVITNVQDVANVFRSFNLTGDHLMDSIAAKLDAFQGYDIEDIKGDGALRSDLTKKAEEIMADLKDLI